MLIQLDVLSSQLSLGMIGTSSILLSLTRSLQPQDLAVGELEQELDLPFGRRPLVHAVGLRPSSFTTRQSSNKFSSALAALSVEV